MCGLEFTPDTSVHLSVLKCLVHQLGPQKCKYGHIYTSFVCFAFLQFTSRSWEGANESNKQQPEVIFPADCSFNLMLFGFVLICFVCTWLLYELGCCTPVFLPQRRKRLRRSRREVRLRACIYARAYEKQQRQQQADHDKRTAAAAAAV